MKFVHFYCYIDLIDNSIMHLPSLLSILSKYNTTRSNNTVYSFVWKIGGKINEILYDVRHKNFLSWSTSILARKCRIYGCIFAVAFIVTSDVKYAIRFSFNISIYIYLHIYTYIYTHTRTHINLYIYVRFLFLEFLLPCFIFLCNAPFASKK